MSYSNPFGSATYERERVSGSYQLIPIATDLFSEETDSLEELAESFQDPFAGLDQWPAVPIEELSLFDADDLLTYRFERVHRTAEQLLLDRATCEKIAPHFLEMEQMAEEMGQPFYPLLRSMDCEITWNWTEGDRLNRCKAVQELVSALVAEEEGTQMEKMYLTLTRLVQGKLLSPNVEIATTEELMEKLWDRMEQLANARNTSIDRVLKDRRLIKLVGLPRGAWDSWMERHDPIWQWSEPKRVERRLKKEEKIARFQVEYEAAKRRWRALGR